VAGAAGRPCARPRRDRARRIHDIGEALHLSQSALSRVVARLERDGLATRGLCPEDRRGIYVCLTDEGRERYEAARPAHRAALADALPTRFERTE
jgi:DNA-binding MarR family transcriptional regulator